MNRDFYEIHSAEYEEAQQVMYTCAVADYHGISYEEAEAFISDMELNAYGDASPSEDEYLPF